MTEEKTILVDGVCARCAKLYEQATTAALLVGRTIRAVFRDDHGQSFVIRFTDGSTASFWGDGLVAVDVVEAEAEEAGP